MTGQGEHGQSTIEVLALLPLLLAIVLAVAQLLAAGMAREQAGTAAHAGAMAILQGEDPEDAAREALPAWSRKRLAVRVRGRQVRVTLRPPSVVPSLAERLTATVSADAGPAR
ncbi:MAG: hypothetical protein JHC95_19900 [Solirubrobacteraceae bacterium]|nr:hypothetical protein [Solirubrobacteraceae bacterium]